MCGIAGIYAFNYNRIITLEMLKDMTNVLHHRGPDGEGFFYQGNVGLGHRRLAIIDLATGQQPMSSAEDDIIVTFNGEIYNYLEIRKILENFGYQFKTNSDTEVIINAYKKWGIDCQSYFNGMWSFALWDKNKEQLFLSRDRIGVKPLYYSNYNGLFLFGSEIKSIIKAGVPTDINTSIISIYLALGYIPAPHTFYLYIHKLKPGNFLMIDKYGIKSGKYWDLPEIDEDNMILNKEAIYEEFMKLFSNAVEIRMRSDVPYGAFLSGGLDSSSVVALMSNLSPYPINTYTVGSLIKRHDEGPLSKDVSHKFGTVQHLHYANGEDFEESFDEILQNMAHYFDEPFGDSSAIPTGLISRHASRDVKMVLTGDGGDEVLSGYPAYRTEKIAATVHGIPRSFWQTISQANSLLSRPCKGLVRYSLNRLNRYTSALGHSFLERFMLTYLPKVGFEVIEDICQARRDQMPIRQFFADFLANCPYRDPFYQLMAFDLKLPLPDDMLVKVDRMSMAHSLEARSPFLDYRLVEFLTKVHKNIKLEGLETKSILRNTIGTTLPTSILHAKKRGFVIPIRDWFRRKDMNMKLETLSNKNSYLYHIDLDINFIKKLTDEHKAGNRDYSYIIWYLFILNKNLSRL